MDAVAADFEGGDHLRFVVQPLGPAVADGVFVGICFCELDKKMIMAGFAFHEAAVKLAEIGVFEPFAKAFEAFAAAGFYEGEDEEPVEETFFVGTAFTLKFHQLIYVVIFALGSQLQGSFL